MSKKHSKINQKEKELLEHVLAHVTDQLCSPELATTFMNKLLTEKERVTIARRLLVASLIQRGDTYMAINEQLEISPNTFAKINKWLSEELPSYQTVLDHTENTTRKRAHKRTSFGRQGKKDIGAPLSFDRIRHKYPAHFLLFNLAKELQKLRS